MKTTLSSLAFVALAVVTVVAKPGKYRTGIAWFREMASTSTETNQINNAAAINAPRLQTFTKTSERDGVILAIKGLTKGPRPLIPPTPDNCLDTTGIVIGSSTFCGLKYLGFKPDGNVNVRMVMRFIGLYIGDEEARLEIPIEVATNEEENQECLENDFTFFDVERFARNKLRSQVGTTVPFSFEWLIKLLTHGVLYKPHDPFILEGKEDEAHTYESQSVLIPQPVMNKLRSALEFCNNRSYNLV